MLQIDLPLLRMISIEEFKEILIEKGVTVDDSSLDVFRDLVDMQADLILDNWEKEKRKV